MDISSIPKTFWHSISLAILTGTAGMVMIAYQSSSVSIEIANAKIQLSSAITETKDIKSDLQIENDKLRQATERLKQKINDLIASNSKTPSKRAEAIKKFKPISGEDSKLKLQSIPPERFKEFDTRIQNVQQYLNVKPK